MHEHTQYVEGCFACKVKTLQFGRVPGGARQGNYFYEDALSEQFGDLDANARYTKEVTEGYGHLRWKDGVPHYKSDDGSYEAMTPEDVNQVMYGNRRGDEEESRRTFGTRHFNDESGRDDRSVSTDDPSVDGGA